MKDQIEELQKFLESIPDKIDIMEEGIKLSTQKEYIEHSCSFDRGELTEELTEEETIVLGNFLFDENKPLEGKKKILSLLAHLGTIEAFRQIEKYKNHPDNKLKEWTALALHECKMFLEGSLLDESTGYVLSGMGGADNRLRCYYMVLPSSGRPFTKIQKDIIRYEFLQVCKDLNSILESVDFSEASAGLIILVPLDVAFGTVVETGINKCNESGNFLLEDYYATNQNVPDQAEIEDIIRIVKGE